MRKPVLICIVLMGTALLAPAMVRDTEQIPEVQKRDPPPPYQLAEVSRGQAITKVLAAGTVQPVVSVVVGSQVSGQVKEILVDHNDAVKQGQPIALLDPELFNTRVEQARAEVDVASDAVRIAQDEVTTAQALVNRTMAERAKAEADTKRYVVMIDITRRRMERKSVLMKTGAGSASEAEDTRAAYETALAELDAAQVQVASQEARVEEAKAQLAVARSRVPHSEAQVRRSQAALHQAEADLDRTVIRAPMNGVVIDRTVTAGQTVAATYQAPTLFTIGDLHAVNVEIAVDEADIGGLRVGQNVAFSVDAYPDKTFAGRVDQIRKSPHAKESVVTYTVAVAANNESLLLFPGMTAMANIIIDETPDALQVPSAALRYQPKGVPQASGSQVWVADGESRRRVAVQVGASNNGMTEIVGGDLSEGDKVIVGDATERIGGSSRLASLALVAKVADWMAPLQASLMDLTKR
jgi:HlyD family secretion protein